MDVGRGDGVVGGMIAGRGGRGGGGGGKYGECGSDLGFGGGAEVVFHGEGRGRWEGWLRRGSGSGSGAFARLEVGIN